MAKSIEAIISEYLGVKMEEVTPDAHIFDDLGADSLDHVEIVMAIEEEYSIEIPDDDCEKWKTVQDITATVERLKK
jgi:acyl carrier protein